MLPFHLGKCSDTKALLADEKDVMNDEEVLEKWPYLSTVCEIMEDAKMFPIMEDATQLVEVLGREISLAVAGDQTSQEALNTVAEEMADMQ